MDQIADLADRRLVVRADASRAAGTGHLMRALALAQAWLGRGGTARWLLAEAPDELISRIRGEGIEVIRQVATRASPQDATALRSALEADVRAVAVLDGLDFDASYLARLDGVAARVLLVDDAADRGRYDVGLVLNQNVHADRSAYPVASKARFLLGTQYALLRREFGPEPMVRAVPDRARNVLVAFGGADPSGMSMRTLRSLAELPDGLRRDIEIRLVVGAANPEAAALEALAAELGPRLAVSMERDVTDMPRLLTWADLAVTSGGSTVWELARIGVPALVVETVPVETLLVAGLARVGLDDLLGRADALDDATIRATITRRVEDAAWRRRMAELGPKLVDGRGAGRIVDALIEEVP